MRRRAERDSGRDRGEKGEGERHEELRGAGGREQEAGDNRRDEAERRTGEPADGNTAGSGEDRKDGGVPGQHRRHRGPVGFRQRTICHIVLAILTGFPPHHTSASR
jgi:hypothetical protein